MQVELLTCIHPSSAPAWKNPAEAENHSQCRLPAEPCFKTSFANRVVEDCECGHIAHDRMLQPLCRCSLRRQPEFSVVLSLKARQFIRVPQRKADVVEPVQQAIFAERIDVEMRAEAFHIGHRLCFEV